MTEEIWKEVPQNILKIETKIAISNKGNIKFTETGESLSIINGFGSKNSHGKYPTVKINNKIFYLHQLVYLSFHPEILDKQIKGQIMYKPFKDYMLKDNGFLRTYLEDLIFIKKTGLDDKKLVDNEKIKKCVHPKYGDFTYGIWYQVFAHRYDRKDKKSIKEKYENYQLMFLDNNDIPCIIRSNYKNGNKSISITGKTDLFVGLSKNKQNKKFLLSHVLLPTAFPDIDTKYTVDHIDDNPKNNNVVNLQWMSQSENAKKGQAKSCLTRRIGTGVKILDLSYNIIKEFKSINEAVDYIRELKQLKSEPKTNWTKIKRAIENFDKGGTAYGFKWQKIEMEDNEFPSEEIWKKVDIGISNYEVSNFGRIKKCYSTNKGTKIRGRKYRTVDIVLERLENKKYKCQKFYVHQLVWIVFNGDIPDGMEILHDEKAPLDEDGCHRNWLQDLKLGTRSDNNKEHYQAIKTFSKN